MKNPDQEIVQFVVEIETDNYELSPKWLTKYNVDTNHETDKLKSMVMSSLYCFKQRIIQDKIDEIRIELQNVDTNDEKLLDLLSEQIVLDRVKQEIAQQLGRIILP
jgi:DNA primase